VVRGGGTGISLLPLTTERVSMAAADDHRSRIAEVQRQAQQLDSDWAQIEQSGAPDRQRINSIKSLLDYRRLWPNILIDLHATLPAPPPAIVQGNIPEIKAIPRPERNVIFLEGMTSQYWPDASAGARSDEDLRQMANMKAPTPTAPGGAGMFNMGSMDMPPEMAYEMGMMPEMMTPMEPAAAAGTDVGAVRGFVITLQLVSPSKNALQLFEQYAQRLETIQPDPKSPNPKRYRVANAAVINAQPIRSNQQRLQRLQQEYQQAVQAKQQGALSRGAITPMQYGGFQGGMMGGMDMAPEEMMMDGGYAGGMPYSPQGAGGTGAAGEDANAPFLDRLLGEDIRNDWEATLVLLVQLDPPKPGEPGTEEQPADEADVTAAAQ
jgi:hypothetical protein